MTVEERNSAIVKFMEKKRKESQKAPADDRKAAAVKLLAATGMYTAKGNVKPRFKARPQKQSA